MPDLEAAGLADPAEEVLVHDLPSFVQLGAVPVADAPLPEPVASD